MKTSIFAVTLVAAFSMLAGCITTAASSFAPTTPHATQGGQAKLCNDSPMNYAVLSSNPPRALHAHSCMDVPFTADELTHLRNSARKRDEQTTSTDSNEAPLPVLTLQGDDDPLSYPIDLRALSAVEREALAAGDFTLQVGDDRNLYWLSTPRDQPVAGITVQPPGFPVVPTAE